MSIFRTNGERFVAAVARFFFFGVWLPAAYLLGALSLAAIGVDSLGTSGPVFGVVVSLMAWGIVTAFLGVVTIATDGNAWFRARQRPVLTWLAGPRIRGIALATIALGTTGVLSLSPGLTTELRLQIVALAGIASLLVVRSGRESAQRDAPLAARLEVHAVDSIAHRAPYVHVAIMGATVALLAVFPRSFDLELAAFVAALFPLVPSRAPITEVGTDGLYIHGERRRFVPFRRGDAVVEHEWGVEILRDDRLFARLRYRSADAERRGDIAKRIRTMVEAAATSSIVGGPVSLAHTAYRSSATSRDVLWRIVDAPELPPRVRIDAAVQLQHDAEEGDDERLATVAESTADPKVRAILREALIPAKPKGNGAG